jgi:FtsP/CotA-like multicopper oxidase with cupredoxin domain
MGSFNFSIDGHLLTIIEADGVDTQKKTVDVIRMGTGQRCARYFCILKDVCKAHAMM